MRTLAVLPVKSFSRAKARLTARLEPPERAALAEAMLGDVLAALSAARELTGVAVVTANARAAELAAQNGAAVVADTEQAGQSPAAAIGVRHALATGQDRVLLVPGDTPLVGPADVDDLLRRCGAARVGVGVVADRHGTGTNALVLAPPTVISPSFGPGSRERHVAAAEAAQVALSVERVEALEHDVDTPDDLAALLERLEAGDAYAAPRTRAALAALTPASA